MLHYVDGDVTSGAAVAVVRRNFPNQFLHCFQAVSGYIAFVRAKPFPSDCGERRPHQRDEFQSAYIQIAAFRKEHVSQSVADDVATKLGTSVEVIPTLVSDPVMYRILVGLEHKDEIIDVIADLMELGISDYFLTHG